MRYVDGSKQELLVSTPQFPALIIAHQEYDSANYHWHSGLEVLYAKDCPVSIGLDGQISILQPGQTRVIPSKAMHAVRMLEDKTWGATPQALSITINPTEMAAFFPQIMQAQRRVNYERCNRHGGVMLSMLCDLIFNQLISSSPTKYLNANATFFALMGKVFGECCDFDGLGESTDHDDQIISMVYRYVQNHFLEPITTTEVAQHFGYSREYFSRLFKRYAGTSFMDYVNELRLKVACESLRLPDVDVRQIGRASGFSSEKAFRTAFERKFGLEPSQWRDVEISHKADEDWQTEPSA